MAADAIRTPSNVKSSAMIPRHPEVPKWIALPAMREILYLAERARTITETQAHGKDNKRLRRVSARAEQAMSRKLLVFVTCGTRREANRLARALVHAKLAACVNILPGSIHSVYRWKGKVETAKETLLLVKTTQARFRALEARIRSPHSYETPEIIALPIVDGSKPYLRWLQDSVCPVRNPVG